MTKLQWQVECDILRLSGELMQDSVLELWNHFQIWNPALKKIDVSALLHVDSAGLALLVYYVTHQKVELQGIHDNLLMLINAYNLELVLHCDEK